MAQRPISDFYGTGWAFPLNASGGRLEMASDEASIAQAILIILQTNKGERVMMPDFGCDLEKLLFSPDNKTTFHIAEQSVERALSEWEPRIKVLGVSAGPDANDMSRLLIKVEYLVRSKNSRHNLVYPFYLRGSS